MTDTIAGLGPIMQLAYVPRDVDATLDFWTKVMGAGPLILPPCQILLLYVTEA